MTVDQAEKNVYVPITIRRASLGDEENVLALIRVSADNPVIVFVPRRDVVVNEQPLLGKELSARLRVDVIETTDYGFMVETRDNGNIVKWSVDEEGRFIVAW